MQQNHARFARSSLLFAALLTLFAVAANAQTSFVEFESGQVRPLAMSPDGTKLFAVNTPDNRLEVFSITAGGLTQIDSIPVGMEPVAVAARSNTEVWVVNFLSDSVSIIDLSQTPAKVVRTLLVGDEPRDIVFAGTNRAFISTAHRGQQRTEGGLGDSFFSDGHADPRLTTAGVGRADVWVFDATSLGDTLGGAPVSVLSFFADTPRALATDGTNVYVAAFESGNQSTTINEQSVCDGFQVSGGTNGTCGTGAPGGVLPPSTNCRQDNADPACEESAAAPEVGVIVKFNGTNWVDTGGRDWSSLVHFSLPDHDVFEFDANSLNTVNTFDHVGTVLFNMVVNTHTHRVYVTNTELRNDKRFEGPGIFGGSTVQGHLSESRITVLNPALAEGVAGQVDPQHLNKHIDYSLLHTTAGVNHATIDAQIPHSLATPLQPVLSSDGNTLYVAAFGSSKIGVFSSAAIEDPSFETDFDPTTASANYISTGGGPSGLVLDETNHHLYVMTRFDNSVRVIDPSTKATLQIRSLTNPEPASVVTGRPFLYDALNTSGNGEASCSSCHIFGDFDSLAWDLGNPDSGTSQNTQPSAVAALPPATTFHPMKGPMTTQTLRGLATHGGMHWRGDRVSGFFGTDPCNQNPAVTAPCSEDFSFRNFIVAFEGLVGKQATISTPNGLAAITPAQMQQFSDFMLQVMLPPNPNRPLNNQLASGSSAANGLIAFTSPTTDTVATCAGCHKLDPAHGFFGSGGSQSFEGEPQNMKVPHYRNLYAKVGMFGMSVVAGNTGPQVRGFGYLHDGSVDTQTHFHQAPVFHLSAQQITDLENFGMVFPTDLAPIVGQQVTLTTSNNATGSPANQRIDLMETRAGTSYASLMLGGTAVTECDIIAKGSVGGVKRGWRRESGTSPSNTIYRSDINTTTTSAALRALAGTQGPITYTCAPPGSGTRMGIDRDLDGVLDGLDNCPSVANPSQTDSNSNGIGDACELGADSDGDGVPDVSDNCPLVINPDQQDFDHDGMGDACDPDDDNDGILDIYETNTGIYVSPTDTGTNPLNADTDHDGIPDGVEIAHGWNPNDPNNPPPTIPMLPLWGTLLLVGAVLFAAARLLRRGGPSAPA
ncbi:MAG TPA: thrombospondin type 3 repeat-containing protein [Myxococcota bacterium]|nr:thrombospondin type 3 repeat-containing protein [Myxococcota bacterium]